MSKSPCAEEQCSHLLFLLRGLSIPNRLNTESVASFGWVELNKVSQEASARSGYTSRTVHGILMNTCGSQDEISAKLLAAATDEVLVTAAKLGDRPAFAELWERHSNKAFKIAYRITRNREDAEDVIQDAWTQPVSCSSHQDKCCFDARPRRINISFPSNEAVAGLSPNAGILGLRQVFVTEAGVEQRAAHPNRSLMPSEF
jgi:hypothetical protein